MLIEIKSFEEFERSIAVGTCIVDFFATWCGPCKMLAPVLEEVSEAEDFQDVKIIEVDIDRYGEVAARYGIQAVPTLILIKDGVEQKRSLGYINKNQIYSFVGK